MQSHLSNQSSLSRYGRLRVFTILALYVSNLQPFVTFFSFCFHGHSIWLFLLQEFRVSVPLLLWFDLDFFLLLRVVAAKASGEHLFIPHKHRWVMRTSCYGGRSSRWRADEKAGYLHWLQSNKKKCHKWILHRYSWKRKAKLDVRPGINLRRGKQVKKTEVNVYF